MEFFLIIIIPARLYSEETWRDSDYCLAKEANAAGMFPFHFHSPIAAVAATSELQGSVPDLRLDWFSASKQWIESLVSLLAQLSLLHLAHLNCSNAALKLNRKWHAFVPTPPRQVLNRSVNTLSAFEFRIRKNARGLGYLFASPRSQKIFSKKKLNVCIRRSATSHLFLLYQILSVHPVSLCGYCLDPVIYLVMICHGGLWFHLVTSDCITILHLPIPLLQMYCKVFWLVAASNCKAAAFN